MLSVRYSFSMKVVMASPFYPPESGILATYAHGLEGAFRRKGYDVRVVSFGSLHRLPGGLRHLVYFFKLLFAARAADLVLSLDTWSVGVPAYGASLLLRKKLMFRIGGDFLWEHYVERTHERVLLSELYEEERRYSLKERLIFFFTKRMLAFARTSFFNTHFQKEIWERAYELPKAKSAILENYYPEKEVSAAPREHVFVSAHRGTWYKNAGMLEKAFKNVHERNRDIVLDTERLPHAQQLERLSKAYAVIIPSISEVGSNTAIEAVSRGRPFIITADTGTGERLDECGLFVDTRSEKALEHALEEILNPVTYHALLEGIRRFNFTHTWDEMAEEILARV